MTTIVTRAGKGSPLTFTEADANFTNLNNDKIETSAIGVTVQAYDAQLADIAGLTPTDNGVVIGDGTHFVVESGATLKTSLGLTIGTDVMAYVAPSTSGNVLTSNGSAWTSAAPASGAATVGAFSNLVASATGASANVTVTADELVVENSSNSYQALRSVSLTIAGTTTGANALDSGAIAGSTWYSIWVIWNGTTTAGLLSTSATSPTLPVGYTHKARVGWIRTDATANKYPLSFKQFGRRVQYKVSAGSNVAGLPVLCSGSVGSCTTPTWVSASVSSFVPSTASTIDVLVQPTSTNIVILAPSNAYGPTGSTGNPPLSFQSPVSTTDSLPASIQLESTNVYWANSGPSQISVRGWKDTF